MRISLICLCILFSSCNLDIQLPGRANADKTQPRDLAEAMQILAEGGQAEAGVPGMERNYSEHQQKRHDFHHALRNQAARSDPFNWFSSWQTISEGQFPSVETTWKEQNPNTNDPKTTSGRVLSIAFEPGTGDNIWIGTASSGLWHAEVPSLQWTPLMDSLPPLGISAIAINPLDTDKLMVGMDTITVNFASIPSVPDAGIFTTNDAGATWNTDGANLQPGNSTSTEGSLHVNHLAWHPVDTNKVFMAANTGVWVRPAYNQTWIAADAADETMLPEGKAQSVIVDPDDPQIITAAYNNHGIYRSLDGGETWTALNDGIPSLTRFRLQNFMPSQGAYFASFLQRRGSPETRIMKLEQDSTTWKPLYREARSYTKFAISPVDSTLMYVGGVHLFRLHRTREASALTVTRQNRTQLHVDQHGIGFHPTDKGTLLAINDGGVFELVSSPEAGQWEAKNSGLHNLQLYSIGQTTTDTTILVLNAQDQGVIYRRNDLTWKRMLKGDGMSTLFQQDDPDTSYVFNMEVCGQLYQYKYANATPGTIVWGGGVQPLRFLKGILPPGGTANPVNCGMMPAHFWNVPATFDPEDGRFMYLAMIDAIYKSEDRALSWTTAARIDSVSILQVDPSLPTDVYAYALDQGAFHHSADRGLSWTPTPDTFENVRALAIDPDQAGELYLGRVSPQNQLYRSRDKGQSWANITGNLSELNIPVLSLLVTPRLPDGRKYVFAGTDLGLFVKDSDASNAQWYFVRGALPYAMIMDIHYNPINNTIRVATFGRGAWQMDLPPDLLPSQPS